MGSLKKPALVFLHGFCEDKSLWDDIIPCLTYNGPIIALNLPGFGNKALPLNDFSLLQIAHIVQQDLINKGVEQCICLGHSLGGYVTLALKYQFPQFIKSIELIHSTAFADTLVKKETHNKLILFLEKYSADKFLNSFVSSLFTESNLDQLKPEIKKVMSMSKGLDKKTIQGYAQAMKNRYIFTKILYTEKAPLFIAGDCDQAIPLKESKEQISNLKNNSNSYILKNVAHMGMYESPSLLIKAINTYCADNEASIR